MSPANSDRQFLGEVTIRTAIEDGRNIPVTHLSERVGLKTLKSDLRRFGFDNATALPSAALGAFETNAFEATAAYTCVSQIRVLAENTALNIEAVIQSDQSILWMNPSTERRVALCTAVV